jgi:hypothetical protein
LSVPITVEQILEETRKWPAKKLVELLDRLTDELRPIHSAVVAAWKIETRQRLAEIENGTIQPIDGAVVSARVRRIVGR